MREPGEREAPRPVDDRPAGDPAEREVVLPAPRPRPDAPLSADRGSPVTGLFAAPPRPRRPRTSGIAELRTRIAALSAALREMTGPGLELDEAQWRVDELAREIDRPYPSPPRVRSRWLRLAPVLRELDPALPVSGTAELIDEAFRT